VAQIKVDAEPGEVGFDADRLARIDRYYPRYVDDGVQICTGPHESNEFAWLACHSGEQSDWAHKQTRLQQFRRRLRRFPVHVAWPINSECGH
jgi:hypothetical protein